VHTERSRIQNFRDRK